MLLFNLPIPGILALRESFGRYLLLFDALWLALLLLVALRVFACYRWICPEGEEDLPKKEGRFERYCAAAGRKRTPCGRNTRNHGRKNKRIRRAKHRFALQTPTSGTGADHWTVSYGQIAA